MKLGPRYSTLRRHERILAYLKEQYEPVTTTHLCTALRIDSQKIRRDLSTLHKDDKVFRIDEYATGTEHGRLPSLWVAM